MSFSLIYWVLMLLWLVFGVWSAWPERANGRTWGGSLMLFILLLLLGWRVFGPPVQP